MSIDEAVERLRLRSGYDRNDPDRVSGGGWEGEPGFPVDVDKLPLERFGRMRC